MRYVSLFAGICTLSLHALEHELVLFAQSCENLAWQLSPCSMLLKQKLIGPYPARRDLFQIPVLQDTDPNSSGYHALKNLEILIEILAAPSPVHARALSIQLKNSSFYREKRAEILGELGLAQRFKKPLTDEMFEIFLETKPKLPVTILHAPINLSELPKDMPPINAFLIESNNHWVAVVGKKSDGCWLIANSLKGSEKRSGIDTALRSLFNKS